MDVFGLRGVSPFQGFLLLFYSSPRASPWAIELHPFGAKNKTAQLHASVSVQRLVDKMLPDSEETQQLLNAARAGDSTAVNALLERHRDSLRRMVQARLDRAVARRVDASDVVQDVLLEAHGRLAEFIASGSMPFHLWLRYLAKDRMIDVHRRHRAQRRSVAREQAASQSADVSSAFDLFAQITDRELTPAAASIRKEIECRFLDALEELDDTDREILLMRHCEHLGNSDVAELLGLSQPAAGMRYLRALRRLRSVLGTDASASEQ